MFGQNLKRLREAKGLNQAELGRLARVTSVAVSLLESGQRRPLLDTALALAAALDCKPEELYGPAPAQPDPQTEPAPEQALVVAA